MKKKVLVVHYSQSGQLSDVLRHFVAPLADSDCIELRQVFLRPKIDYPFPWPFLRFFGRERIEENFDLFDFALSPAEMGRIDALAS